jgi:hypothetical protein
VFFVSNNTIPLELWKKIMEYEQTTCKRAMKYMFFSAQILLTSYAQELAAAAVIHWLAVPL